MNSGRRGHTEVMFEFFEDINGRIDKENLENVASVHFKKNMTGLNSREKCLRKELWSRR